MAKTKPMTEEQIEKEVEKAMETIRDMPAMKTDQPQSVSKEFLDQLRSAIQYEMDGLHG